MHDYGSKCSQGLGKTALKNEEVFLHHLAMSAKQPKMMMGSLGSYLDRSAT